MIFSGHGKSLNPGYCRTSSVSNPFRKCSCRVPVSDQIKKYRSSWYPLVKSEIALLITKAAFAIVYSECGRTNRNGCQDFFVIFFNFLLQIMWLPNAGSHMICNYFVKLNDIGKILVAYFSHSGNTKKIAEEIQSKTGILPQSQKL